MRTDSFGVTHPEMNDEPSIITALHISECGPCQDHFADVMPYIQDLVDAFEAERLEKAKHKRSKR